MRKLLVSWAICLVAFSFVAGIFGNSTAGATFNQNDLMDDSVFVALNEQNTSTPSQIDAWLNQFPYSCISSANGFTTPDPQGWDANGNALFGPSVSAGQAIYDAGHLFNVNPQVIIATMQKEQSIITGAAGCYPTTPDPNWPPSSSPSSGHTFTCTISGQSTTCTYACPYSGGCMNIAMSYGCPGYCSARDEGFSMQLMLGTWLLRFGQQRAEGNLTGYTGYYSGDENFCYYGIMTPGYHQRSASSSMCDGSPGNTVIYYDGTGTLADGTSISLNNGATSTLYNYTPYISGNQKFVNIFESWFGSTTALDYSAQAVYQQIYTDSTKSTPLGWNATLLTGQTAYAVVVMQNNGNVTWTQSGGPGVSDVRLATYSPWGRQSGFCTGAWIPTSPTCTRPAGLTEASVATGQSGTFEFPISAPGVPGVYNEHFGLVVDGKTVFPNGYMNFQITVQAPNYSAQPVYQQIYTDSTKSTPLGWNTTLAEGQQAYAAVVMKNTGNMTWTQSGTYAPRLVTYGPWGRQSGFCTGAWIPTSPTCTRPVGLTESSVAPGQIGTFEFPISAPGASGLYNERFGLVIDGQSVFNNSPMNFQLNVVPAVYSAQPVYQDIYTDSTKTTSLGWDGGTLTHGQSYWAQVVMKNTGNITWTQSGRPGITDTRLATYNPWGRQSGFCTGAWIVTSPTCTRPVGLIETSVAPGQTGTFEFPITTPATPGTYNESFGLVVDGKTTFSSGFMNFQFAVQ